MCWLIGAILFLFGYVTFEAFDWLLAGRISSSIIPYFSWLNPQSTTGGLLLSMIIIVPVYMLLTLLVWLKLCHWRNKYAEYPDVLNYLNIHKEGQKKSGWPIIPLGLSTLILGGSFFGVLFRRIDPSHWVVGVILLLGLFASWLFPESVDNYKRAKKPRKIEPPRSDKLDQKKKSVSRVRIRANEMVEKLKTLRSYRGQCVYRKHENGKADTNTDRAANLGERQLPTKVATNEGFKDFYDHQLQFLDFLNNRRNTVLTTPVGSGKATVLNAFALHAATFLKSNVLIVCPNEKLGEQTRRELYNMLQQYENKKKLSIVSFISEEGSDNQDKVPNILITSPETLHRYILPLHRDVYELFFTYADFVLLTNVEYYNGIFGANVAFVLRRLLRICESKCDLSKKKSPTIGATGNFIANGNEFLNELTGKEFSDDNHISVDTHGYGEREIIFWNPPFERIKKPSQKRNKSSLVTTPDHKRRSFYDEVCELIVEVFIENYDVALIGAQVSLTSHDIRNTSEKIFEGISAKANEFYTNRCREIADWLPERIKSIHRDIIMADEKITDLSTSLEKTLQEDSKKESMKKKKEIEEKKIQDAKAHRIRLKKIREQIVHLTQTCQELFGTHKEKEVKIDDAATADAYFDELTYRTKELRENAISLQELIKDLPDNNKGTEIIDLLAEAEGIITQIDERIHSVKVKHTKILSRASEIQDGRWIAASMRDLKSRGIETERVNASFFLGFPSSLHMLWGDTIHTAAKSKDSLTCVMVNPQPLSQYYMKTHLRSLDDLRKQKTKDDEGEVQLMFTVGLNNEYVIYNHLLCAIYELDGSMSDLKDILGILPNSLHNDNRISCIPKTLVKQDGDSIVLNYKQQWLSYCGEMQFTKRPHLDVFLCCAESAYSVKKEGKILGIIDSGIKTESWFDGAISSMSGERYKVESTTDLGENGIVGEIRVSDQISEQLTEHRGTAIVKIEDYLIILPKADCFGEGWLGRVRAQEMEGFQKDSLLNIGGKAKYIIDQIDHKRRTVQVESIQSSQDFRPITLTQGEIFNVRIEQGNPFTFRIEAGNVNVRKEIKGYTVFNCIDPEQTSSPNIPISRRSFNTYGLFVVFKEPVEMATLHSLAHLIKEFVPSVISCAPNDIEVTFSDKHEDFNGNPVVVLYDNYSGSLGLVESLFRHRHSLLTAILQRSYDALAECPCKEGCSCCLHILQCRGMPKAKGHGESNKDMDKKSALVLLGRMLGITEYKGVVRRRYDKIDEDEDGYELREKVFTLLSNNLGIKWKKPVALVVDTELEQKLEKEKGLSPRVGVWTDDTLVVREYPEDQMVHVISHEYTHDWQGREKNMDPRLCDPKYIRTDLLKNFNRSKDLFVEGFAEWVAYRALDFYGLKYIMEPYGKFKTLPLVYRAGFEVVKYIEDEAGSTAVLDFIKTGEGWDFEDLYRNSGVRDYVLSQLTRAEKMATEKREDRGKENPK